MGSNVRVRGRVVWFNDKTGFGFVKELTTEVEYFVHYSQIQTDGYKQLEKDQLVEFQIGKHNDKLQADKVVVVEE